MSHRTMRGALVGALIAWQAAYPAVSEAGFFDWLFHRNCAAPCPAPCPMPCPTPCAPACPTIVQSPCSTCAPAIVQPSCSPCGAGATAYSPVMQPAVAAAPYQTVHAQVPVTYYRPTVGAPAMAGCTAVQVQAQRRVWWNPLGLFGARGAINPNPINVHYPTTVAYPGATVLPGPAAGVAAPSYAAPNYASPGYGAPSYGAPGTPGCSNCGPTPSPAFPSVPSVPVNPGTSLGSPPAATYPAPAESTGGGTTVPADQPPSLNQSPNLNAPAAGGYQGSSYRPAPAQPITPPDALAPSGLSNNVNAAKPAGEQPAASGNARDLQLIPYPGDSEPVESTAPPLLNGRGKTASLRSEEPWSYTLIAWPEKSETRLARHDVPDDSSAAAVAADPRPAAPAVTSLDDGGWRPARNR